MFVEKRDGSLKEFDLSRIVRAIDKASAECGKAIDSDHLARKIAHKFAGLAKVPILKIQEQVEHVLQCSSHKDVAKAYIMYRHDRDIARENKGLLYKTIQEFLDQTDELTTRENANKDSKAVTTHRDLIAGLLSKHYATRHILPKNIAQAHKDGYIHVHDLDYMLSPLTNCQLVNYRDMLENGFRIGDAEIEKPRSIGVAATVLTQIIQGVASAQYGGQSIAHIDTGLAPYVEASHKKILQEQEKYGLPDSWADDKLAKEVLDAMQTFLYQVNTLTTTNGQTPFITISLGLGKGKYERLITEKYLFVHNQGLGKDKVTPVFPKVIFMLEDGVNLKDGDPNYDLKKSAIVCSSNRIYPDYISAPLNRKVTGSTNTVVTAMGCRSFLSRYVNENGEEQYDGRFNMGVVSLNLPMIAMESDKTLEGFLTNIRKYMEMSKEAHLVRVNRLLGTKARQNPMLFMHGAIARLAADETIDKLFYNGYASISIGFIGLFESLNLIGLHSKENALGIVKAMRAICDEFKAETKLGFSLYGTPSEGYALRAATCLRSKYGAEVCDREYLTNSFHQPVWENTSPIEKWQYEVDFATYCSGGHIGYIEQPSLKNNLEAYEKFIDYAYQNLPYFGINTPVDKCFKCGYSGEFEATKDGYTCAECGNREEGTISVVRRISGYLTAPNSRPVNRGKQQEIMERVKHK